MTDSPAPSHTAAAKPKKDYKVLIKVSKILGIIALLFLALIIGLAVGYQFITKTSGWNIFRLEIWQRFFQQIRALR